MELWERKRLSNLSEGNKIISQSGTYHWSPQKGIINIYIYMWLNDWRIICMLWFEQNYLTITNSFKRGGAYYYKLQLISIIHIILHIDCELMIDKNDEDINS